MAAAGLTAEALADIVSVAEAALLADHKRRLARAAELFGRAAERAVAAGVPPDSLIYADLRMHKAAALECLSCDAGVPAASAAAMHAESWATVREVMRTLSARDQAGRLLPGTLPADELAFSEVVMLADVRIGAPERLQDATLGDIVKSDAPLLGYDLMMRCGIHVFTWFGLLTPDGPPLAGAEAEAAHAFVLRVLALVAEVRHGSCIVLGIEAQFIDYLKLVIAPERRAHVRVAMLPSQFYDALVAAWNAPALQAALRSRGTLEFIQGSSIAKDAAEIEARQAADVAAVGLHACGLPACGAREVSVHQFKRCGGCKAVAYCSAECAKAHWKAGHKRECSRAAMPAQPNQ